MKGLFFLVVALTCIGLTVAQGSRTSKGRIARRERLVFDVITFGTCGGTRWDKRIELPTLKNGGRFQKMRPNPDGSSCYKLKGFMNVLGNKALVTRDLQYYISIKSNASRTTSPIPCIDYNEQTGCGGSGSCLYCSSCAIVRKTDQHSHVVEKIQMYKRGRRMRCSTRMGVGKHSQMAVKFCIPNAVNFAKLIDVRYDLLKKILADKKGGKQTAFMTLYTFDKDMSKSLKTNYRLEKLKRRYLKIKRTEPIPYKDWVRLPFNRRISVAKRGYIGCTNILGSLKMVKNRRRGGRG